MKTVHTNRSVTCVAAPSNALPHSSESELKQVLTTAAAAKALNRAPQTLRKWACLENGPIRPIRVHGRLAWPLDEIKALLEGGAK